MAKRPDSLSSATGPLSAHQARAGLADRRSRDPAESFAEEGDGHAAELVPEADARRAAGTLAARPVPRQRPRPITMLRPGNVGLTLRVGPPVTRSVPSPELPLSLVNDPTEGTVNVLVPVVLLQYEVKHVLQVHPFHSKAVAN